MDVIVLSYSALRRSIDALAARQWYYAVLDEGHAIQNPSTATSKAAKALQAKHRLVLSGTPVQVGWFAWCVCVVRGTQCVVCLITFQNNVLDLWSLFDFLMPGYLRSYAHFRRHVAGVVRKARRHGRAAVSATSYAAASKVLQTLHRQVLPFVLRRLKTQVLKELPPKVIQV